MPQADSPGFFEVQRAFTAHIRDPDRNPPPGDVEPRRMQTYVGLVHRNIASFLANGFPVAKAVLAPGQWQGLVQGFIRRHPSETPYFMDITQEFMAFLDHDASLDRPDWLLELCHYEWVRRSLASATGEIPDTGIDPLGDLLAGPVVVSPLARPLCYRYRVHEIEAQRVPSAEPGNPTWLFACRRRDDSVHVVTSNALTHRLVELLQPGMPGSEALAALAAEFPGIDPERLRREGCASLERLRDAEILLGVSAGPPRVASPGASRR